MSAAHVRVVAGPEEGLERPLPLGGRLVVGRGPRADVSLSDPRVSRRHCLLEHRLSGLFVSDLESSGGTLLDGAPLPPGGALVGGDAVLTVGDTRLELRRGAPASAAPEVPGVRVGRRLGEGGSGSVYEGVLEESGRRVAVKVLAPDADAVARRRFERELSLQRLLVHPAIARILDLRLADGRPCLVRELIDGPSLEEWLAARGRAPWRDAAALGKRVAGALEHAHGQGVVHRDVKPANVILGPAGAVLIDFDLARRAEGTARASLTRLTETGQGLGSLCYLAPEQLTAARDAGPAADVYGLGATLYHALSGRRPFEDVAPEDFVDALLRRGPRPLDPSALDLPQALAAHVARACMPRPTDRFDSARALGAALAAVLG